MTAKKIIAVFGPDNNFLSYCTKKRALKLVKLNRAIKVNKQSIKLIQTKKDRALIKHNIISESNRICYICNTQILDNETATVDHVIPKSRIINADFDDNMKCCCNKCNLDKGNMILSEYINHIHLNKFNYKHIEDSHLYNLNVFAKSFEQKYYS